MLSERTRERERGIFLSCPIWMFFFLFLFNVPQLVACLSKFIGAILKHRTTPLPSSSLWPFFQFCSLSRKFIFKTLLEFFLYYDKEKKYLSALISRWFVIFFFILFLSLSPLSSILRLLQIAFECTKSIRLFMLQKI